MQLEHFYSWERDWSYLGNSWNYNTELMDYANDLVGRARAGNNRKEKMEFIQYENSLCGR